MYKLLALFSLLLIFPNCTHYSVEQQTTDALHGRWEIYEMRYIDPTTNNLVIRNEPRMSMNLLSPWYGADSGIDFLNRTDVSGKFSFSTDWNSSIKASYTFKIPNKLTFNLDWIGSYAFSAEIIKLDASELWLKKGNPYPQVGTELRLKRVQ
jgi:hypothetical protein